MKLKRITIDCFDSGPGNLDRYTIAISGLQFDHDGAAYTEYLAAGDWPFHPQGFGQHVGEVRTAQYMHEGHRHLGKRIFFHELPQDVQRLVAMELTPE